MAREVLGVAGAAVGSMFGPVGAQIGFAIGSALGSVIDPQYVDGPALSDAGLQTSRDGVPIPIGWGITHVVGNIIQMNPIVESTKKTGGKKGGVKENIAKRTFGIGIGRGINGPIVGLLRCWENNKLIYDVRAGSSFSALDNTAFEAATTLYLGTETQLPDPEFEAETGVDNTPAYRALAYIVFNNKDITNFGSSIPSYRFEIYAGDGTLPPAQIGVLAWWELEDTGGSFVDFFDEVSSQELTATNTIVKVPGVIGEGVQLTATGNQYIEMKDITTIFNLAIENRNWSCQIWHTTESPVIADAYVVNAWSLSGGVRVGSKQWRVKTNSAGNGFDFSIAIGPYPDQNANIEVSTGDIGVTANSRYHIVVTHDPDADEMTITVNSGTRFTETITTGCIGVYDLLGVLQVGEAQEVYMGVATGTSGNKNECEQDMLAFFDVTLQASDIQALYNGGDGIDYADLMT